MNDEEINRAIAEHLGWKWFDHPDTRERTKSYTLSDKWVLNPAGQLVFPHSVRNYCGDLNAMHEAEKVLFQSGHTDMLNQNYWHELWRVCGDDYFKTTTAAHATARQRAEAFLRTVGKWRGEE